MYIREIEYQDCENLSALSIYVWLNTYANGGIRDEISRFVLSAFTQDRFRAIVRSSVKRGFTVISGRHVLGVAVVNVESHFDQSPLFGYEIETLYVHPQFQRRGIGQKLLKHLQREVGDTSWLTTWVHNYDAIGFYTKNGYTIVGEAEFRLSDESHVNHVFSNKQLKTHA